MKKAICEVCKLSWGVVQTKDVSDYVCPRCVDKVITKEKLEKHLGEKISPRHYNTIKKRFESIKNIRKESNLKDFNYQEELSLLITIGKEVLRHYKGTKTRDRDI